MAIIGYARVSSTEQNYNLQIDALKNAGCSKIFAEKKSGTSRSNRAELSLCLDYLRENDTLVITRIDRLARSLRDLQNLVYELKKENIEIRATEQPIDTKTASGKAFLDMLSVFAEFETNLRRERQMEGISKAKKEGKYKGRKATAMAKSKQVLELVKLGRKRREIADELNIGVASVYRILKSNQTSSVNLKP